MTIAGRLFDWLMAHRLAAATLLVLATVGIGAGAARLKFDNSYRIFFKQDDPALRAYDTFLEEFGSDEAMVLAVQTAGDPFSTATLRAVKKLSDLMAGQPGVINVWSLTRMDAMLDAGGALEFKPLFDELPASAEQTARAKKLINGSPLYRLLVAEDRSSTVVLATLEPTERSFDEKAELVRKLRRLIPELVPDRQVWLAGVPVLDEAMFRYSAQDTLVYGPVMVLVIIVCLLWLFRSLAAVLAPLVVVLLAIAWSLGLMGWAGWDANVVTAILPPILAAIGIADSVHLLQQLRFHVRQGQARRQALRVAFEHVLRPCLITSLTTAAGLASLVVAPLPVLHELGLAAAVGVLAAFLLTMVGLPVILSLVPLSWLGGLARSKGEPSPRWLQSVARWSVNRRGWVALASAAAAGVALAGIFRLDVSTSMTTYFFEDDPVFQESVTVDRALGGSMPMEVLVQATGAKDLLEPGAIKRIDAIARYLQTLPATGQAHSSVDFLSEARRVIMGHPPHKLVLPKSRAEAAQLLLLLEGEEDLARYLSDDRKRARVEVAVAATRYDELVDLLPAIEQKLARIGGDQIEAHVTGLGRLLGGMETYLVSSQVRSFGLAFLLVMGFIALLFRSLRVGLLSSVPNLLPLLITLGFMGWVSIALDATTIMIAPVLLGIVVDDTVHMIERVLDARRQGQPVAGAFTRATGEVGHAVVMTTIILCLGFMTPLLGSFKPNAYFALLSALALMLALLADLVVFPAVACLAPWLVPGRGRS